MRPRWNPAELLVSLPPPQHAAFLKQTSERELEAIEHDWGWWGGPTCSKRPAGRRIAVPDLVRIVVAIDPAVSTGGDADETAEGRAGLAKTFGIALPA
jgi:hypothetical protein